MPLYAQIMAIGDISLDVWDEYGRLTYFTDKQDILIEFRVNFGNFKKGEKPTVERGAKIIKFKLKERTGVVVLRNYFGEHHVTESHDITDYNAEEVIKEFYKVCEKEGFVIIDKNNATSISRTNLTNL